MAKKKVTVRKKIVSSKREIDPQYSVANKFEDFIFPNPFKVPSESSIETFPRGQNDQLEIVAYVRHRLGEPIMTVELDDEQIKDFYAITKKIIVDAQPPTSFKDYWEFEYTTALAMETLAIARMKYEKIQLPDGILNLQSLELLKNAKDNQRMLMDMLNFGERF